MKTSPYIANALVPNTKPALQELVRDLYLKEEPLQPCGLGTRLNWGPRIQVPSQQLSVKGLNRIIDHAKDDLTITVEAGTALASLQLALAKHQQWLAVDWPWGSNPIEDPISAGTVGGLVARGLSGSLRYRYMGLRDQLIGIELIRTDGIIAKAGGKVVKNVAGYDLMRLLCGSWGSLAIITELTLRVQPMRPIHLLLNIEGELKKLEAFRSSLVKDSFTPEFFDWVGNTSKGWNLELGLASVNKSAIKDQLEGIENLAKAYQLKTTYNRWQGPLMETPRQTINLNNEYWLLRLAMPAAKVNELLSSIEIKELSSLEWRISAGIGVGDGWQSSQEFNYKNHLTDKILGLRRKIKSLSGQMTILNQITSKNNFLPAWLDADSRPIIEAIKEQFDPKKQLSIGRIPGIGN